MVCVHRRIPLPKDPVLRDATQIRSPESCFDADFDHSTSEASFFHREDPCSSGEVQGPSQPHHNLVSMKASIRVTPSTMPST